MENYSYEKVRIIEFLDFLVLKVQIILLGKEFSLVEVLFEDKGKVERKREVVNINYGL